MYPYLRLALAVRAARKMPPIKVGEPHISHHIIRPSDIDLWLELNNGRTLTLYDLGRMGMFVRLGIVSVMQEKKWAGTIAGSSVRYRHRVRAFQRVEMRSQITTWDDRFVYSEQSMWYKGRCTSHGLLRMAVTSADGLVTPDRLAEAMDLDAAPPPMPDWIKSWTEAEAQRPWPPMAG